MVRLNKRRTFTLLIVSNVKSQVNLLTYYLTNIVQ